MSRSSLSQSGAFHPVDRLTVYYAPSRSSESRQKVGRLAIKDRRIFFEYDPAFLSTNLQLSPFRLPLRAGVFAGDIGIFQGLMGVFEDSLPDGWGRLLLDRKIAKQGISPASMTPLDRLAWVGHRGMGALSYEPEFRVDQKPTVVRLEQVEKDIKAVLSGIETRQLDQLIALGGSPQGARPKALIQLSLDGRSLLQDTPALCPGHIPYLVKFRAATDDLHCGTFEQAYALMAKAAGINMPETRILGRTKKNPGYFAIRRFDRLEGRRVHLHSLSGLLHAPHTYPALSYRDLLLTARELTRDESSVAELFRRACFNVFARNRDDHSKNFAFLMDESGAWRLSPAFDLTRSEGPGGEHAMIVGSEGRNPSAEHLLALAKEVDLVRPKLILEQVRDAVSRFAEFAEEAGLPKKLRKILD